MTTKTCTDLRADGAYLFSFRFLLCCSLLICGFATAAEVPVATVVEVPVAAANEVPQWESSTLSGDWGGKRSSLSDRGLNLEFTHRSDVVSNMEGGLQRGNAWLSYTDARLSVDLEKLQGWSGLTAFVQYHGELGNKPNANLVGSFMGEDNIEVATCTTQFQSAWLQKNILEDSLSVLLGLYPADSEFYVTVSSGLFIHPSLGMAAEIAQTGVNGPPVYPFGSMGTRIKYTLPNRTAYLQLAVLDGVPGDPSNQNGTQIRLDRADGTFAIAEIGYTPLEEGQTFEPVQPEGVRVEPAVKLHEKLEGYHKTAFGMWRYSRRFDDLQEVDAQGNPLQRASFGWYALAERTLYAEEMNTAQGLAGFLRFGVASAEVNRADWSASMGLRYTGLFSGRDLDGAGIVVTNSHASSKYRGNSPSVSDETMIEVTYRFQLQTWLAVQPFGQRVTHPGMDNTAQDASLLGTRLEIFL